jgi:hypothetical protein
VRLSLHGSRRLTQAAAAYDASAATVAEQKKRHGDRTLISQFWVCLVVSCTVDWMEKQFTRCAYSSGHTSRGCSHSYRWLRAEVSVYISCQEPT